MSVRTTVCVIALCTLSFSALAQDAGPTISFGGFIRADYGSGDRYPESLGEDRLGVSKAALATSVEYQDVKGVFVIGTEALTDGFSGNDGDVDIKDAFIVIGANNQTGFSASVGAQPLLFGLKPNGYPGDRSLQPSLEYGGAGAFAVSNQAGPSLIGVYTFNPMFSLRFGAFDLSSSNSLATDGSSLTDNFFAQVRGQELFNTGLYAVAAVESLYVGGAVDDSHTIFATGVGYKYGMFDASVELNRLDGEIVGAADDEQYLIAEVAFLPNEEWLVYVDWADADQLDANTFRLGATYRLRKHLALSAEYSKDDFDVTGASDVDSVDLRVTLTF